MFAGSAFQGLHSSAKNIVGTSLRVSSVDRLIWDSEGEPQQLLCSFPPPPPTLLNVTREKPRPRRVCARRSIIYMLMSSASEGRVYFNETRDAGAEHTAEVHRRIQNKGQVPDPSGLRILKLNKQSPA